MYSGCGSKSVQLLFIGRYGTDFVYYEIVSPVTGACRVHMRVFQKSGAPSMDPK